MDAKRSPAPLTVEEIAFFRALSKPAILLLLMLRLARPANIKELAELLGMSRHTIAMHLQNLVAINLAIRLDHPDCYILTHHAVEFIAPAYAFLLENGEIASSSSTTTTTTIDRRDEQVAAAEEVIAREKFFYTSAISLKEHDVFAALLAAGIGEPKRSQLAALPHVTPQAVSAWELFLRKDKGDDYRVGLLVHVLETGDPAPRLNDNGHLDGCKCLDCQRYAFRSCPDCGEYICQCE